MATFFAEGVPICESVQVRTHAQICACCVPIHTLMGTSIHMPTHMSTHTATHVQTKAGRRLLTHMPADMMNTHVCTHIYTHVLACVYAHACIHVYTLLCAHVYDMSARMPIPTHVCTCLRARLNTSPCTCLSTCLGTCLYTCPQLHCRLISAPYVPVRMPTIPHATLYAWVGRVLRSRVPRRMSSVCVSTAHVSVCGGRTGANPKRHNIRPRIGGVGRIGRQPSPRPPAVEEL